MSDMPKVANILRVYNLADTNSIREGLDWYSDAYSFCHTIDPLNPDRAAGITAALSPMNEWKNNKNKAAQLYRQNGDGTKIGLFKNVAKAIRIYNGEAPLDVLGGEKVRAFYDAFRNPWGDGLAVIDRHAFDIAVGERTNDKRRGALGRKGVYESFSAVYSLAAAEAGISVHQMQAVTWVFWRKFHGIEKG